MKCIAMFSGGLDSIVSAKLVQSMGIEVVAVNFYSIFFSHEKAERYARENGITLHSFDVSKEYVKMLRNPKYGYGRHMNPCIDCKILMLKMARKYAKKIGAKFIITGEVLGQRPMSQHKPALGLIEKESGLKGKLLRPLSAKLLPETEAEKKGWVDREKLMGFEGRKRSGQEELAKKLGVKSFPSPAGGCLLCEEHISAKLKELFSRKKNASLKDVELLKLGRHFKCGQSRIVVGRNKDDNSAILAIAGKSDYIFEVEGVGSPVTLLRGRKTSAAVKTAAELTARYSSAPDGNVEVSCKKLRNRRITVKKPLGYDERKMMV